MEVEGLEPSTVSLQKTCSRQLELYPHKPVTIDVLTPTLPQAFTPDVAPRERPFDYLQ